MIIGINNKIPTSNTNKNEWLPTDEPNLIAWYRHNVGVQKALDGTDKVVQWSDQSGNGNHMIQNDDGEMPIFDANGAVVRFDKTSDTQNLFLISGRNIELDDAFMIGIRMNPDFTGCVVLGSNSTNNELMKINSTSVFRIRNDVSGNVDFTLSISDGSTKDDSAWTISRKPGSGAQTTYVSKDGRILGSQPDVDGTFDIDTIGVRNSDLNPFDGDISEIIIYQGLYDRRVLKSMEERLSGINN